MFPEWQHQFIGVRPSPIDGPRHLFKVTAGLHYLQGNQRPYFSVTGELYRPGARDIDAGGMMHEYVMRLFPELNPVLQLHLSDDTGRPMHAAENAWYQLAGYYGGANERYHAGNSERQVWRADGSFDAYRKPTPDECLQSFADYVRISVNDARRLADEWRADDSWARTRQRFDAWISEQAERWQREANSAIACLDLAIASQGGAR